MGAIDVAAYGWPQRGLTLYAVARPLWRASHSCCVAIVLSLLGVPGSNGSSGYNLMRRPEPLVALYWDALMSLSGDLPATLQSANAPACAAAWS